MRFLNGALGGGDNPFMQGLRDNSNALMLAGLGLAGGQSGPQAFQNAMTGALTGMTLDQGRRERAAEAERRSVERNATLDYLQSSGMFSPEQLQAAQGSPDIRAQMLQQSFRPTPAQYRTVTGQDAEAMGLNPNRAYNLGPDGKISQIGTGPAPLQIGSIPPGYRLAQGDGAYSMEVIPGGPADQEAQQQAQAQQRRMSQAATASDIVTTAAARAREAANQRDFGEFGQGAAAMVPWTDAAEVQRQVDVLKASATLENLNAMRQASPTGGALGNVTEGEGRMLANRSGALDPSSPNFLRDLADYERVLLRTIHGDEAGDRIFEATRPRQAQGGRLKYNSRTGRLE